MITYRLLELHANNVLIGSFGALYALFPLILAIPLGHRVNQFGEGRFVVIGTGLIVVSTLGLMSAHSIGIMIIFVAMLGTSQFLCMVGAQALVGNRSPGGNYEKFFGYYTFSAAFGQMIGPAIGAAASGSVGVLPKSTSHGFLAAAVLGGIALLPILSWVRMRPTNAMSAKESRAGMNFNSIMANPGMKVAMFTSLAIASSIDVLVIFLPVFGKERGFTSTTVGTVLVVRAAASMVSRLFLGSMSRIFGYQRLLLGSIAISTLAYLTATFAKSSVELISVMAVAGFVLGIGQPMTMAWVSRKSKDDERSFAISIRLAGNRLGQFLMPAIAGLAAAPLGAGAIFAILAMFIGSTAPLVKKSLD